MAHARGLLKGGKFNGRHSTVISGAVPAVEAARDHPLVTKISLGVITPIKAGPERIKFTETDGGIKMQVRGSNAVQMFYLYTTETEAVIRDLTEQWDRRVR